MFTAFSSALNAGLPIIFDREFGFLNRILVTPLSSRISLVIASALITTLLSLIQTSVVIMLSIVSSNFIWKLKLLCISILVVLLLVTGTTAMSLDMAFLLPGHVELIAITLLFNLPVLFSSTALVPMSFLPTWLQVLVSLNPLSYSIEPIRYLCFHNSIDSSSIIMNTLWANFSIKEICAILLGFNIVSLLASSKILSNKLS